jgi:intracellular sulfur oxidation DsrE/DsrF family protein
MAENRLAVARRSFLSRLGLGMAALGAGLAPAARAQAQSIPNGAWQPALHPQDDWLGQVKGVHRFVFDTTTPDAAGGALLYANNFIVANKSGYNLEASNLAIVIVLRHFSTPFAYTDAIWAKHGAALSELLNYNDPKTKQPLNLNIYNSSAYGMALPNFGTTIDALGKQGVQFAVCAMATRFFAGALADKTHGNADAIYQELVANLVPNSHLVPAGIVAVNRAQERGYAFAYVA